MSKTTKKTAEAAKPALWNPNAAIAWSLLFTPILGSLVQANNWKAIGRDADAIRALNWSRMTAIALLSAILVEPLCPHVPAMRWAKTAVMIGSFLIWLLLEARKQPGEFKSLDYERRPWGQVVMVGCLGGAAFAMFGVCFGLLMKILGWT